MRGHPQFSFGIPKALANSCFLCISFKPHKNITVIVCTTHRKNNIRARLISRFGKYIHSVPIFRKISLTVKSALLLYYLFYNLLLIRSFTTGSGTFILSRWSLLVQLLVFTQRKPENLEMRRTYAQ